MDQFIEILMAVTGTLGFCLIFHIRKKLLICPLIGGAICWIMYLAAEWYGFGCFAASVFSAACVGVFGELIARKVHAPTTVFFIPACVPLIPGGSLYRTMYYAMRADWSSFRHYGSVTLQCTMGIAVGLGMIQAFVQSIKKIQRTRKQVHP